MPIFYLHIHNAHGDAEADEGIEASSLADAREQAITGIRDLLSSKLRNGGLNFAGRIDILNATRETMLSVPFRDAVAISGL